MMLLGPLSVFLSSLSAIPLAYILNQMSSMREPYLILIVGILALVGVSAIPYFLIRNKPQRTDNFFYVMSILTFSSVIDLVIGLENDGIIANFMSFYLRDGEPYLKTAHGTMVCYWDGIAHYAMYLMILAAQSWNQSYRDVGLYWAASFGHSMVVLMPGIFMGHHGVRWPCLLNVPYMIVPFYFGVKFLFQRRTNQASQVKDKQDSPSGNIWKRPLDIIFIIYFVAASCLAVLRFIAALGGNVQYAHQYRENLEPYLGDPSLFAKAQMIVYLFYFLPYYAAAIYGLLHPGQYWMLDWALIHAGATAQGQFSHIGASFHYRTPYVFRVPQNGHSRLLFWLINGGLMLVPQFFAYRCINFPRFFSAPVPPSKHMLGDMDFMVIVVVVATSLTSLPIAFVLNGTSLMKNHLYVFAAGAACLSFAIVTPAWILKRRYRNVDFIIYVFALFCWSGVIDLFIALELDGYVSGYMQFYFLEGEPYLNTSHGTMINYWDGTVHYTLQLSGIILFCLQESYREVSLYWSGSILNSMLVLLGGALLGKGGVRWSYLLNVPYLFFPLFATFKAINERPLQARSYVRVPSIMSRPVDLFFFLYFIVAIGIAVFRGFAVLGADISCMNLYVEKFEPYLTDESSFPKMQMLVYTFYYLFYYLCAIHGLLNPGQLWMADWAIIHAGASAQAQFVHISSSLHHRTPKNLLAPLVGVEGIVFWGLNLALMVVPHLFALRCWQDPDNFGRTYTVDLAKPVNQAPSRLSYRTPHKRD